MALRKKSGHGISVISLTAVYAVTTAVVMFIIIFYFNSTIVMDTSANADTAEAPVNVNQTQAGTEAAQQPGTDAVQSNPTQQPQTMSDIAGIPSGAVSLSFSGDGRYCSYCFKGELYIVDIPSGKTVKRVAEKSAITYAAIMYDRNIIIYFTGGNALNSGGSGSNTVITVNTYNIDTGLRTVQYSLKTAKGAVLGHVDYSSMTGHVAFDIYNGKSDDIYYMNIMKDLVKLTSGEMVDNMVMINSDQIIYYEKGNTLYCQKQPLKSLQNVSTKLLGCDLKDYVYVQSLSDTSLVYVLKGTSIVRTIHLDNTDFSNVYSNKTNVYLVYPGYLLNLSAVAVEKTVYDKAYGFTGLIDNRLYLSDGKGNIIIR